MPRLFPSLTRSREHNRDDYKRYDEYGQYDNQQPSSSSAWRRVMPGSKSKERQDRWEEEVLDFSGTFQRQPSRDPYSSGSGRNPRRSTVQDYDGHSDGSYDERYRHDAAIPIVQRENSLSRLQEAFADHGISGRPVTQVSLPPQGTPGHTPMDMHPPMMAPSMSRSASAIPPAPHPTPEMRGMATEQQHPTLVPSMTVNSHHGDIFGSRSQRAREKRPEYRDDRERARYGDERRYTDVRSRQSDERARYADERARYGGERSRHADERRHRDERDRERERSRYRDERSRHRDDFERVRPRRGSSSSSRFWSEEDEDYPPCVVVVERGRNGKKDTYYVLPGGAPVVFEDDKGNELTRVGDFSGRYKPQRQRPVIIEDEHGREIGRLGFDDASSLDYNYRRNYGVGDDYYDRDRGYTRQAQYSQHRDDHRSSSRSHRSAENSSRYSGSRTGREEFRHDSPTRGRSPPSPSGGAGPNVVYIPPSNDGSVSSGHSGRSSRRNHESSRVSHRSHDNNVIVLDEFAGRQVSGSVSSRSSGRRSHDSEPRRVV